MSTETKQYKETREQCQSQIDAGGNVCSQCGAKLTPIETVDNSGDPTFWMGCEPCCKFDYGVKPIVFQIAKELVTAHNHVHYSHMDSVYGKDDDYKKYWLATQVGGTSKMVSLVIQLYKKLSK